MLLWFDYLINFLWGLWGTLLVFGFRILHVWGRLLLLTLSQSLIFRRSKIVMFGVFSLVMIWVFLSVLRAPTLLSLALALWLVNSHSLLGLLTTMIAAAHIFMVSMFVLAFFEGSTEEGTFMVFLLLWEGLRNEVWSLLWGFMVLIYASKGELSEARSALDCWFLKKLFG